MPKANILNEIRKPERELKKEFTVRLAPFPHGLNRSLVGGGGSPSMSSLNSPRSPENNSLNGSSQNIHNNNNNSTNSFMMNGGIAQQQQTTTSNEPHRPTPTVTGNSSSSTTAAPRPSNKRPIFSNDSSEDEATFKKKLKNQILDDIDLDDSEMFDETAAPESAAPKKGAKRPTLPFENDLHLSNLSPLKRVKNNEILSSYSSTSASTESRSTLNKRKFQHSPEESANSNNGSSNSQTKVKKRTYIEELELLTSDQSPYYKNIYNTESSTSTTTTTPKRTTLPSLLPSKDQQNSNSAAPTINGGQRLNDQLATTTTTTTSAINEPDVIDLIDDSEVDDDDDDDDDDDNCDEGNLAASYRDGGFGDHGTNDSLADEPEESSAFGGKFSMKAKNGAVQPNVLKTNAFLYFFRISKASQISHSTRGHPSLGDGHSGFRGANNRSVLDSKPRSNERFGNVSVN